MKTNAHHAHQLTHPPSNDDRAKGATATEPTTEPTAQPPLVPRAYPGPDLVIRPWVAGWLPDCRTRGFSPK